jgi:hypothetical protein
VRGTGDLDNTVLASEELEVPGRRGLVEGDLRIA